MAHSVEKHLAVSTAAYDAEIRRFIPAYEAMIDEAADALVRHLASADAPHVLDLGAGTGALTEAVARRLPRARFTLLDADSAMLAEAKARLRTEEARVAFVCGSFFDALPSCDVAMASLSLHHVHDADEKRRLYRNIHAALPRGGLLVNADATVSADDVLRERTMKRWAEHLIVGGDTEAEAFGRFSKWADEDRYFSAAEELAFLRDAGFSAVEVAFRVVPCTVLLGRAA